MKTTSSPERDDLRQRLAELRELAANPPANIVERYKELEMRFSEMATPPYMRLLESPLDWTPADHEDAVWGCYTLRELASLGVRIWEALACDRGDVRARYMIERTLLYMGGAAKWECVVSREPARNFRAMHAMLRFATDAGYHRQETSVVLPGRVVECSIEALYFRALLLARFSSGSFGFKQLEILDQWMWLWTPVLYGTPTMPAGGAFRVDLDTNEGLRPGNTSGCSSCLYLPVAPIQKAYASIVAEFHAGRIVPAEGIASRFRLEEHVAVLEIARRGLSGVAQESRRYDREPRNVAAELVSGLGKVIREGFAPADAPVPSRGLELAALDGEQVAPRGHRLADRAIDSVYQATRRIVRIVDESTTGIGIEGESRDLNALKVGELVSLRIAGAAAPVICKVARHVPVPGSSNVHLGLARISSEASVGNLRWTKAPAGQDARVSALYIPGKDASGRHDAWLVSEREFALQQALEAGAGGKVYAVRLNRVRDQGPGWVLAGFQVISAKQAA